MDTLSILRDILEASVEKNGEKPLTNKHLLNILKMAMRKRDIDAYHDDLYASQFEG